VVKNGDMYSGRVIDWGGYQVAVVSYFDRALSLTLDAEDELIVFGATCVTKCLKALAAAGSVPPAIIVFFAGRDQIMMSLICPEANDFDLVINCEICRDALRHPALARQVNVEALTERPKPSLATEEDWITYEQTGEVAQTTESDWLAYEQDAQIIGRWRDVWGAEARRHPVTKH
jgi:hypothetical protein